MEDAIEILENHKTTPGYEEIAQNLLHKVGNRQSISFAAIKAKDKIKGLEDEKAELSSKCQQLRSKMDRVNDPAQRETYQETLEELEHTVTEFMENWDQVESSNRQVADALRALNQNLARLPNRIANPNGLVLLKSQWPKALCERLVEATQLAFQKYEYMASLLNRIDEKEDECENILRGRRQGLRKY